jgi:uncharacterized protein with HEPN domain
MSSDHVAQRLADIFYNIERIENHIRGTTKTKFLDDELLNDGVERCLERIAEAARKIGDHYDDQYPDINLPALRRLGSILRRDYDTIRPELIWDFVKIELPKLKEMAGIEGKVTGEQDQE